MSGRETGRQRRVIQNQAQNSPNNIAAYLHKHGYRMGNLLGEGSYSKVRLCTRYFSDGTPAYRLACKVINKKKASEDFVLKFLPRELEIVSRIEHPNIVRVFDVVEFDQQVYIFMDCCDKGDLLEYVKSRGMISEDRTRHYYKQIVSAIEYLHKLDIAHRDLKCENVLMAPRDQIRISDFGFSRYCRDTKGRRVLSNTYCGSAAYAAPEILQGTHYNPKLYDMWSLGCVLFIMLTGHMPYDESDIPRMLRNQVERVLVYPNNTEEKLTTASKNLIRRLLEPDTLRRANVEQAKCHEWVGPSDYYEAGDGTAVGKENLAPPSRTRSDNGSSSSSGTQHLAIAGDNGLTMTSKLGPRNRRIKPDGEPASLKNSPRNKPGSVTSKIPSYLTSAPSTTASRHSARNAHAKSLKQLPAETHASARKPEPGRYRSAMSGVTNLFHSCGSKTGSRSSRPDVQ